MPARAEARPAATGFLTIQADDRIWAIPSQAVVGVEAPDERASEPAIELLALLTGAPHSGESRRVIVLELSGQRVRLLAPGLLGLSDVEPQNLLPLPDALLRSAPLLSHVALVDAKPRLLVISPERLLRALESDARSASIPPLPEARSC